MKKTIFFIPNDVTSVNAPFICDIVVLVFVIAFKFSIHPKAYALQNLDIKLDFHRVYSHPRFRRRFVTIFLFSIMNFSSSQ